MGVTEGKWRLKAIIILALFIFCMYSAQALFGDLSNPTYYYDDSVYTETNSDDYSNLTEAEARELQGSNTDLFSLIGGFWGFLTFQTMGIPYPASLVIQIPVLITWIVLIYISYTIIYEIIKGLPFT